MLVTARNALVGAGPNTSSGKPPSPAWAPNPPGAADCAVLARPMLAMPTESAAVVRRECGDAKKGSRTSDRRKITRVDRKRNGQEKAPASTHEIKASSHC
jgi:hypothetical protein